MTSAVCSVARSVVAATALHALCFSAVKVGERTPSPPPRTRCARCWSQESDVASRSDRHGPSEHQGRQAWRRGLSGHLGAQSPPGRASPTASLWPGRSGAKGFAAGVAFPFVRPGLRRVSFLSPPSVACTPSGHSKATLLGEHTAGSVPGTGVHAGALGFSYSVKHTWNRTEPGASERSGHPREALPGPPRCRRVTAQKGRFPRSRPPKP